MRVYLMVVGTQDPFNKQNQDGPTLSFLKQQPIDPSTWVVLISTQGEPPVVRDPTFQGGEATKAELLKRFSALRANHIVHETIKDVDPSNFGKIAPPMRQLVQEILKKIKDQIGDSSAQIECVVNVSPGTPQMQAVWYLMAHAGHLKATLLQTKQGADTIESVSISPLAAEQFIELGLSFFQDYSFNAASEAFKRAASALETYEPERVLRAKLAQEIATAYHDWSIFQYEKATERLQKLVTALDSTSELRKTIEEQVEFLHKLPEPIPKYRAINLMHAARLEYDRHDMVESIWRAGAAYEQVLLERALQIAEQRCGFRPNPFQFKESLTQTLKRIANAQERQRLQQFIAECQRMDILQNYLGISLVKPLLDRWDSEFKNDPFWAEAEQDLAWVRNNAVHRSEPVTQQQARRGLEIAQEALQRTFGPEILNELDDCPCSAGRLTEMRKSLTTLLKG
ncbi:MAG: hypothetical protein QXD59_03260 [Candidatus Caldarchaeum sp.]